MAHDPVTVAPLRRQAVADIAKDCAPTIVTAVIPQARAWMNTVAGAGERSLDLWLDRLKSGGEAAIIESITSKNCP